MSWRYSDLVSINQDFIDVFTAEEDKKNTDAWMRFVPHGQMLDMLRALLDSLERTSSPKPLWMHGQYGTGKTMCLFVLKHLLEDPIAQVERYFGMYRSLSAGLLKRIVNTRQQGPGLVVYLSSSGHIDTNLKFMATLQRAIQEGLEARGMQVISGALFDQVLERIGSGTINWPAIYDRNRAAFLGLASSAEDVVAQLADQSAMDDPPLELLDLAVRCLEDAGIVVVDSADAIKAWLQEVIEANRLNYLVCMWDEFTEFFTHNAGLDGLQELAHLSAESPFYLVLATHREPRILEGGRRLSMRKIGDRFKTLPYMMEPVTATRLMAGVMQPRDGADDDWAARQDSLFRGVQRFVLPLTRDGGQKPQDYLKIAPLHPYAAFVLSTISQGFASANRTVFRFMKSADEQGLPRFLETHPRDEWLWYTADGLWSYFFGAPGPDTPDQFRDVVGYYASRSQEIEDADMLRAFRAILLLIGLEKAIPGDTRVMPNLNNLNMLFSGTPLHRRVGKVMDQLAEMQLVHRVGTGRSQNTSYTIAQVNVDDRQLERFRTKAPAFRDLFASGGAIRATLGKAMQQFPERLRRRMRYEIVSCEDLQGRRERVVAPSTRAYQIPVVMVLCEKRDDVVACKRLTDDIARERPDALLLVIDEPFGAERMAEYREDYAQREYSRHVKDVRNEQYYEGRLRDAIREWAAGLNSVGLTAWLDGESTQVSGMRGAQRILDEAIAIRFPHRPDAMVRSGPAFSDSHWGVAGAEIGLGLKQPNRRYTDIVRQLGPLVQGTSALTATRLDAQPDHAVTHMKRAIDPYLAKDDLQLVDVWRVLQGPPFGVPPSPIGVYLMGLMLRECCDGYYWIDGAASHQLDATRLAQLITETLKTNSGASLLKSSVEERQASDLLARIFRLPAESSGMLVSARDALTDHLQETGYPLWALGYCLQDMGRRGIGSMDMLDQFILADPIESFATQERLRSLSQTLLRDRAALQGLDDAAHFRQGMLRFLTSQDDRVSAIMSKLDVTLTVLMLELARDLPDRIATWRESDVAQALPRMLDRLELVAAIGELTGAQVTDMSSAAQAVARMIAPGKLPLGVLACQDDPELTGIIRELDRACREGRDYPTPERLAEMVGGRAKEIRAALEDPVGALRRWSAQRVDLVLSDEDVATLWSEMYPMSDADENGIAVVVRRLYAEMTKSKSVQGLRQAWNKYTGTDSPADWSNQHQIPVSWLFDTHDDERALRLAQDPANANTSDLDQAVLALEQTLGPALARLTTAEADAQFVQIAAGSFAPLLEASGELDALRDHLRQAIPGPVADWRQRAVQQATTRWIAAQYAARYLPDIQSQIASMRVDDAKALLAALARDPQVGVAFLSMGRTDED